MTLRDIVARVNEWADWTVRLESSGLGYPSCTAEARTTGGGKRPPGPIVPNVVMNPWAVEVDRAIREMPAEMAALIEYEHITGTTTALLRMRTYCQAHGISSSEYRNRLDRAYWRIGEQLESRNTA